MQHPILFKVLLDIELRNYNEAIEDVYLRTCARYLAFLGGKPLESTDESGVRVVPPLQLQPDTQDGELLLNSKSSMPRAKVRVFLVMYFRAIWKKSSYTCSTDAET